MKIAGLALLGIALVMLAGLFVRGVDVVRQVVDANGNKVFMADGRPMYERDRVGQFMINWEYYVLLVCGAACLACAGVLTIVRIVKAKTAPSTPPPHP